MNESEVKYATLQEIAERWGLPMSWIYERSRKDALPGQRRLGGHVRVNIEEFEEGVKNGALK